MLDWLGGVTSTVSFCQLSGGVRKSIKYYINNLINYRLRREFPGRCTNYYWVVELCKIYMAPQVILT